MLFCAVLDFFGLTRKQASRKKKRHSRTRSRPISYVPVHVRMALPQVFYVFSVVSIPLNKVRDFKWLRGRKRHKLNPQASFLSFRRPPDPKYIQGIGLVRQQCTSFFQWLIFKCTRHKPASDTINQGRTKQFRQTLRRNLKSVSKSTKGGQSVSKGQNDSIQCNSRKCSTKPKGMSF